MTRTDSKDVTLSEDRAEVALNATFEICQLSRHLAGLEMTDENDYVLRGIALRINSLNGVVLSALNEPNVTTSDLRYTVYGVSNGARE